MQRRTNKHGQNVVPEVLLAATGLVLFALGLAVALAILFYDGSTDTIYFDAEHTLHNDSSPPWMWVLETTGWPARHLYQSLWMSLFFATAIFGCCPLVYGSAGTLVYKEFETELELGSDDDDGAPPAPPPMVAHPRASPWYLYVCTVCFVMATAYEGEILEAWVVFAVRLGAWLGFDWEVLLGWVHGIMAGRSMPHETVFNITLSDGQMAIFGSVVFCLFVHFGGVFPVAVLLLRRRWGSIALRVLGPMVVALLLQLLGVQHKVFGSYTVPAGHIGEIVAKLGLTLLQWADDLRVARLTAPQWAGRVNATYGWWLFVSVVNWASMAGLRAYTFISAPTALVVTFLIWIVGKAIWMFAQQQRRNV